MTKGIKKARISRSEPTPDVLCRRLAVLGLFFGLVQSANFMRGDLLPLLRGQFKFDDMVFVEQLIDCLNDGAPALLLIGSVALLLRCSWGRPTVFLWVIVPLTLYLLLEVVIFGRSFGHSSLPVSVMDFQRLAFPALFLLAMLQPEMPLLHKNTNARGFGVLASSGRTSDSSEASAPVASVASEHRFSNRLYAGTALIGIGYGIATGARLIDSTRNPVYPWWTWSTDKLTNLFVAIGYITDGFSLLLLVSSIAILTRQSWGRSLTLFWALLTCAGICVAHGCWVVQNSSEIVELHRVAEPVASDFVLQIAFPLATICVFAPAIGDRVESAN